VVIGFNRAVTATAGTERGAANSASAQRPVVPGACGSAFRRAGAVQARADGRISRANRCNTRCSG